jgi:polyribonucleotide nucleotidyltransferase
MEKTLIPTKMIQLAIDQLRHDALRSRGLAPYIEAVERSPSCAKPYVQSHAKVTPRTMHVPKNVIALVIGSRGKTVRAIEDATDTKITINQAVNPCLLTFAGPEAGVVSAQASITNIVDRYC